MLIMRFPFSLRYGGLWCGTCGSDLCIYSTLYVHTYMAFICFLGLDRLAAARHGESDQLVWRILYQRLAKPRRHIGAVVCISIGLVRSTAYCSVFI